MEYMLRCNAMKCRRELGHRALVTTCSHIFCTDCAGRLGLTDPSGRHEHQNSCPACGSPLTNLDDAVITDLNPSEDYKTSVLSGLSPNIIIECASRAMSFWAYQATQEVAYQEYLGKTLTEKYTNLSVYLDKTVNEANSQTESLNNKLSALDLDLQNLHRKNDELARALKEKNKKLLQTQELYDKLKRKAMMGQMQYAAEDAADASLQAATGMGGEGNHGYHSSGISPGTGHEPDSLHQFFHRPSDDMGRGSQLNSAPPHNLPSYTTWARTGGAAKPGVPLTPSTHRQRVGEAAGHGFPVIPGSAPISRSPRPIFGDSQSSLRDSNFRGHRKFPTVGLTSGLKVSHAGGSLNEFSIPSIRPQANRSAAMASVLTPRSSVVQPSIALGSIQNSSIASNPQGGFALG